MAADASVAGRAAMASGSMMGRPALLLLWLALLLVVGGVSASRYILFVNKIQGFDFLKAKWIWMNCSCLSLLLVFRSIGRTGMRDSVGK